MCNVSCPLLFICLESLGSYLVSGKMKSDAFACDVPLKEYIRHNSLYKVIDIPGLGVYLSFKKKTSSSLHCLLLAFITVFESGSLLGPTNKQHS